MWKGNILPLLLFGLGSNFYKRSNTAQVSSEVADSAKSTRLQMAVVTVKPVLFDLHRYLTVGLL